MLIGSEGPAGNVLKLRPPMCFGPEHADRVVATLREVLGETAAGAPLSRPPPTCLASANIARSKGLQSHLMHARFEILPCEETP